MATATVSANYVLTLGGRKTVFDDDIEVASKLGFCAICPEQINPGNLIRFGHYGSHRHDFVKVHDSCFRSLAEESGYELTEVDASNSNEENISPNKRSINVEITELPQGTYAHRNKYAIMIDGKLVWATSDLRRAEGAQAVLQLLDLTKLF